MGLDPCRYPGYPTAAPGVTSRSPLPWVYPSSPISRLLTRIWRCPALNSQSLEELGIPLLLLLFLLLYILCSISRRGDAAAFFFFQQFFNSLWPSQSNSQMFLQLWQEAEMDFAGIQWLAEAFTQSRGVFRRQEIPVFSFI